MRNLDVVNPEFFRPSKLAALSAFTLLAMTLLSVPLADAAAPNVPIAKNPILLVIFLILGASFVLVLISVIFRWGSTTRCYGVAFLSFASVSYLGVIPCMTVVLYGGSPYWAKTIVTLFYAVTNFLWCRKFVKLYAEVFNNEILCSTIYEEEPDAVYYMRRGDDFLLKNYFKFSQMPRDRYFLLFIIIGFLMVPMMSPLRAFFGLPFVHIFLLVAMLPVSWMSIGFAVRGFLVFYLYPAKIKRTTGKDVYVDLATKPQCLPLKRPQHPSASSQKYSHPDP